MKAAVADGTIPQQILYEPTCDSDFLMRPTRGVGHCAERKQVARGKRRILMGRKEDGNANEIFMRISMNISTICPLSKLKKKNGLGVLLRKSKGWRGKASC